MCENEKCHFARPAIATKTLLGFIYHISQEGAIKEFWGFKTTLFVVIHCKCVQMNSPTTYGHLERSIVVLKVRQSHNDFFKMTILPKNEQANSTLLSSMIPSVDLFSFIFWKKLNIPEGHFEITVVCKIV